MDIFLVIVIIIVVVLLTRLISSKNNELKIKKTKAKINQFQIQKSKAKALMQRIREREEVDNKLKKKLIQMLGGNMKEAEKLVAKQRFAKDGKYSENYCWWLAIRDLEEQQNSKIKD